VRTLKGVDGIKYSARRIAARVLFASGAVGVYRRLALRDRAVVLMYHRVGPEVDEGSAAFEGMQVDPVTFNEQMAYLRQHFNILALDDMRRHLRNRTPFPRNSCLVTFDDGWKDNYTHAYPVLKRYEIPAVVFLSVGHIGKRTKFWPQRTFAALDAIRKSGGRNIDFQVLHRNLRGAVKFEDIGTWPEEKFREEVREQIRILKKLPLKRIEPIVDELSACAGTSPDEDGESFLSWEDVVAMSRGGIDFGSHGLRHEILTNIPPEEVREDVRVSKALLEERIRKNVYAFSYPNGNHDPVVRKHIGESGYEIAFGTSRGFAGPDDDPYSLNRVNVHDDVTRDIPMFLTSILGMI